MTARKLTARFASTAITLAWRTFALALIVGGAASVAQAMGPPPPSSPEISPGSLAGALTILTGGILLIADRVRSKRV